MTIVSMMVDDVELLISISSKLQAMHDIFWVILQQSDERNNNHQRQRMIIVIAAMDVVGSQRVWIWPEWSAATTTTTTTTMMQVRSYRHFAP